jgi:transposase
MAFRKHLLSAEIEVAPKAAADEMAESYRAAQCSRRDAAALLDIGEATYKRWTLRLDELLGDGAMTRRLAKIKAQALREGWHHRKNEMSPGPPRMNPTHDEVLELLKARAQFRQPSAKPGFRLRKKKIVRRAKTAFVG